jgi:hypothetical protein
MENLNENQDKSLSAWKYLEFTDSMKEKNNSKYKRKTNLSVQNIAREPTIGEILEE